MKKNSCNQSGPFLPSLLQIILFFILFLTALGQGFLFAGQDKISIAVLPFENMNGDEDQDYLKGIIRSILIEDLTRSGDVLIVERDKINDVLKEQRLQLTGLLDEKGAIKAGKLMGASSILKGSYVFLGQDVFINITLVSVETGSARTFSYRGFQENTVHTLSEKLLSGITGKKYSLQTAAGERSILAIKQLEPGTLELFSPIVDSRVYIDEGFVGYTKGKSTVPLVLEIPPGKHTIRTHLTKNFGVIDLPEVSFRDWEREFKLLPGQKITLEDETRHFNDQLYKIMKLLRKTISIVPGEKKSARAHEVIQFTDRDGADVEIILDLVWKEILEPKRGGSAEVTLIYQNTPHTFTFFAPSGKDVDFSEKIGKVKLNLSLECSRSYAWDLDYDLWRTDVHQGMHRE